MQELVFLKLGGSLITDKQQRYHFRAETVSRLAQEVRRARDADSDLQLVVGHGSGSFGHVAARESGYNPALGHPSPMALARVGAAASNLNHLVRAAFLEVGLPVLSLPPSACATGGKGRIVDMSTTPFRSLLDRGMIPLTYGDVLLDRDGGSTIASTETVFRRLALEFQPRRLLLLGLVEGVYERAPTPADPTPPLIPSITSDNWDSVRAQLGGSHGTDVTGGMMGKVQEMLDLVRELPTLEVRIASGEQPGLLEQLLRNPAVPYGTRIHAEVNTPEPD